MKLKRIYVELTNVCGLQCSFCPSLTLAPGKMEPGDFDKLIVQSKAYTREVACHVMGDPLTLPNLPEYLDIIARHGLRALLTTSGYYLKKHSFDTLFHPAVKQINISLNSYNKNDSAITLGQYMAPIAALCREKLARGSEIFVNLRLWNLNESCSDRDYNESVFAYLSEQFGTVISSEAIYTQRPRSLRLENKILLHFDDYFEWPSLANPVYGDGTCHGLGSHIGVLSDGRVVPCCLDGQGVMELGNIHDASLSEILHTPRAEAIREGFKKGKAVEELCQRCSYKIRFGES